MDLDKVTGKSPEAVDVDKVTGKSSEPVDVVKQSVEDYIQQRVEDYIRAVFPTYCSRRGAVTLRR